MLKDKKQAKKEIKSKALVDLQRQTRTEARTDELLKNDDLRNDYAKVGSDDEDGSEDDADLEEERMMEKIRAERQSKKEEAQKA